MLFDIIEKQNRELVSNMRMLVNKGDCSDNIKNVFGKVLILQNNVLETQNWTTNEFKQLNSILNAYFGNNVPSISKEPIIYINQEFKYNTETFKEIYINSSRSGTPDVWELIRQLESINKEEFPETLSLTINDNGNILLKILINLKEDKISVSYRYNLTEIYTKINTALAETFLLWLAKNIKKRKKEDFIDKTSEKYKDLLYKLEIDNLGLINNEVMMATLFKKMDLNDMLEKERIERDQKLDRIIREMNMLNDEYELKIKRLTEYVGNFKDMYDRTVKTITFHTTKTKYLYGCPKIDTYDNNLYITIKTNMLPVLNLDNMATYIKSYSTNHNEEELKMLEKIKNGEAFLAVAPELVQITYNVNNRSTSSRSFNKLSGPYNSISKNEHAHVGSSGCLGTYANTFNEAARDLDINKTIINVLNYLQSISPLDAAGKYSFKNMVVLDEFGEKIIYSKYKELIGKTREEVSKEIWQESGY